MIHKVALPMQFSASTSIFASNPSGEEDLKRFLITIEVEIRAGYMRASGIGCRFPPGVF
jgi:hypothetical protein